MATYLDRILASHRAAAAADRRDLRDLIDAARRTPTPVRPFAAALAASSHRLGQGSGVAVIAFAALGLRVYDTLHATAFDLAFFDQILWNTAHGRWFETSYVPYNFLGQHFEPLLLLPAALYRLGAGPRLLIVGQSLAAGLAALPLYWAGRRLVGAWPACLVAVAFLLSPTLQRGVDFGFHPDLFEPLLAFGALAALLAGRRAVAVACLAVLLLVKDDAFLPHRPRSRQVECEESSFCVVHDARVDVVWLCPCLRPLGRVECQ